MQKFIHQLKQKPDHVRRRVAIGTSAGFTALVAIIWVTALTSSGTFALSSSPAQQSAKQAPTTDAFALDGTNVHSNISQLVGAVDAATGATTSKPSLTIIDGKTTSSFDQPTQASANPNNTSATVIPF